MTVAIPLVAADAAGLVRGDDLFAVTLAELESARHRAWGSLFIVALAIADDPLRRVRELCDALARAAARGVDVRLVIDRFVADDGFTPNLIAGHWLEARGVAVRLHGELDHKTNHTKAWIIDDAIAMVGSGNWSTGGLTSNLESGLRVRSPALAALLAARFDERWSNATALEAL